MDEGLSKLIDETFDIIREYPDKMLVKLWSDMSKEQKADFLMDNLCDEATEWVEAGCLKDFREGGKAVIEIQY